MIRLVYHSICKIPRPGITAAADIKDILQQAITNNPRLGITGGLVFTAKHFIQVMEGPRDAVGTLSGKILLDPRHTGIHIHPVIEADDRLFGQWSMGFAGNSEIAEVIAREIFGTRDLDPTTASGAGLVRFVHEMIRYETKMVSTAPAVA